MNVNSDKIFVSVSTHANVKIIKRGNKKRYLFAIFRTPQGTAPSHTGIIYVLLLFSKHLKNSKSFVKSNEIK